MKNYGTGRLVCANVVKTCKTRESCQEMEDKLLFGALEIRSLALWLHRLCHVRMDVIGSREPMVDKDSL